MSKRWIYLRDVHGWRHWLRSADEVPPAAAGKHVALLHDGNEEQLRAAGFREARKSPGQAMKAILSQAGGLPQPRHVLPDHLCCF